jgi:hypothetical protein
MYWIHCRMNVVNEKFARKLCTWTCHDKAVCTALARLGHRHLISRAKSRHSGISQDIVVYCRTVHSDILRTWCTTYIMCCITYVMSTNLVCICIYWVYTCKYSGHTCMSCILFLNPEVCWITALRSFSKMFSKMSP